MSSVEEHAPVAVVASPGAEIDGPLSKPEAQSSATDAINLRLAIERLFSKEILERSPLLLAYISAKMSVPLSIVAQHLGFYDPTGEFSALSSAIQDSDVCAATPDGGIRPVQKQQQHTVILRDVPSSTPADAILNILREKGCTGYKSIRSELNDTWFITFESEQDARDSIFAIRDATLDGKAIRARLKTESIAKSLYQATMEQAQTQPWHQPSAYPYAPTNVRQQRYQHNSRPRSDFGPHQANGGSRNNRNRPRRQYGAGPPMDAANHYQAMQMQAMWAAQFGQQHMANPSMMPMQMQSAQKRAEPGSRGTQHPRRSGTHAPPRSPNAPHRHTMHEAQQLGLDETSSPPRDPAAVPSTPADSTTNGSSSPAARSNEANSVRRLDNPTEETRGKRNTGNQQPRPRRTAGVQRRDSDASSPRNERQEGGRKPAGKRKPQPRKNDKKSRDQAPEFTDADFPVLSSLKLSSSAPDLSSGYAEALKRGANGHSTQQQPTVTQPPQRSEPEGHESKAVVNSAADLTSQDSDDMFQFFSTPPDPPMPVASTAKSAGKVKVQVAEVVSSEPVDVSSDIPPAKLDALPVPDVAQAADFESFPYMDSSGPSTSKTTAWAGKKSFLEAVRKQDQAV